MLHIGEKIKEKLKEQGRTVVWFSKQINRNRTDVYSIFSRQSIDTKLLLIISKVLNFNFFIFYTEQL